MRFILLALLVLASGCMENAMAQRRPRHRRFAGNPNGSSFPVRTNTQSCDSGGDDSLLTGAASKIWGGVTEMTECFWMKEPSSGARSGFIHYNEIAGDRSVLLWMRLASGDDYRPEWLISQDGSTNQMTFRPTTWSTADVSDSSWFLVCMTLDTGETGSVDAQADVYINGVSVALTTTGSEMTAGVFDPVGGAFSFLFTYRHGNPPNTPWRGKWDEYAFWDVALSAAEILEFYNAGGDYDYSQQPTKAVDVWYRCEDSDDLDNIFNTHGSSLHADQETFD